MDHTLFSSPASPYVRKTRVFLRELDLGDRVAERMVSTNALDTDPDLAAANPLGRIPALARTEGPTLCDSRVITRYLNDLAGGDLYPAARLWDVLTLEALCDGMLDSAVSMVYERRLRKADKVDEGWLDAQWRKVSRTLDSLEADWTEALSGPLDAGQIALACALGYLDLRHDDRGWRDTHPALVAWLAEISTRPSLAETAPA
ncbi:glutathione S-transferase [Pseudooceanicola antarcticus]|uniref:Glutathione S-transferase n=1 Tax=Pseudooceanicola antarcticus TaxID=1247613 RepID=A0A285HX11_9RHOB|nr:glutathione S-transferase family protein [Pseudooceanicola antarcticus]PJE27375.1 glutathione S-transferase family protein [Pseudooceanicola antarcticus]SNY40183.1 glutathione S-transferase [Pseudooceanicola antarcticus]